MKNSIEAQKISQLKNKVLLANKRRDSLNFYIRTDNIQRGLYNNAEKHHEAIVNLYLELSK